MGKSKITKIVVFIFVLFIFTFLSSGILIFFLNGNFSLNIFQKISENYTPYFTYTALTRGYPRTWESIFYAFIFWNIALGVVLYLNRNQKSLHGDAKFASKKEIKDMGLLQDKGLVVGKLKSGELLKWNASEFLALGAPTRSGKGVGIVIPNLMEWEDSCVVLDIKQECFDFSSKYRKEILNQEVYLFNPFDFRTHRYNPFTYIDLDDDKKRDKELQKFSVMLYPTEGKNEPFFDLQAQALFIGLAYLLKDLMLSSKGQEFLEQYKQSVEWTLNGLLELSYGFKFEAQTGELDEDGNPETVEVKTFDETCDFLEHQEIMSNATRMKLSPYRNQQAENTKSSIMASFNAPLLMYGNQPTKSAMATSDFDLREVRKKKMTIYIGITPNDLSISRPILNMFFSQLLELNTEILPDKDATLKYSCLLLMDEFTSIGVLPPLKKAISFIAGYNLRVMMIFQAPSQLEDNPPDGYGKDGARTLRKNMGATIYYAPREVDDAKEISEVLGDTTFNAKSKSYNHGKLFDAGSSSHSISEQKRALMLPQELLELEFEKQIIKMPSKTPILCNKAFYYNDDYFIDKFKMVSPHIRNKKSFLWFGKITFKDWKIMLQNNETSIQIPIQKINN